MNRDATNHVLGKLKRWEEIPVNDVCAACGVVGAARQHLEARLIAAGYFYAIAYDAFMPPSWVEARMR